jgi:hypothetical protein
VRSRSCAQRGAGKREERIIYGYETFIEWASGKSTLDFQVLILIKKRIQR